MVKIKIVWDKQARKSLKDAYHHISKDSLQQAEKVKTELINAVKKLAANPLASPPDKYRKDKDKRFRAFEKYNYRISYLVIDDAIRVLRVRHVKQEPMEY